MTVFLVRHGRPAMDTSRPASEWELDPASFDDVWALRESGRLPARAVWFSSPEPKALQTAQLLTDDEVNVVEALREHVRSAGWVEDFADVVARALAEPSVSAAEGWEPIDACRARVTLAVGEITASHSGDDIVLVGHGTAWTVAAAALTGTEPDLERWQALAMPDVVELS